MKAMLSAGTLKIRPDEYKGFMENGYDFIDDWGIENLLRQNARPEPQRVRDILAKSRALQRLEPEETAALLNIESAELWEEVFAVAAEVRERVYGNRVVTFAPLYCSNLCVNSCLYCGFRRENRIAVRRKLELDEVAAETRALVQSGHKRLIVVFGEHPQSDVRYMTEVVETIYRTRVEHGEIRRVNINAAPLCREDFRLMHRAGIGTYQIFQETYRHDVYHRVHPRGPKSNYPWRLYALHRAQEAGVDDVGVGILLGLYHWRFEVLGLMYHVVDLEKRFGGVGPHTLSFPRINEASGAAFAHPSPWAVSDEDLLRLVAVLRLSVPYTGMIITAREPLELRLKAITIGCTQTDAASRIGIGAYSDTDGQQRLERQQFMLRDQSGLEVLVRELARRNFLTSFCTACYRSGRTGDRFMELAKSGMVHRLCLPNALLTFREYLLDYAGEETRREGQALIERETEKIDTGRAEQLQRKMQRIERGERDVFF